MPPLTGVAVKVTEVPAQIVVLSATMLTEAVRIGLTVTVIGYPELVHPVALFLTVNVAL